MCRPNVLRVGESSNQYSYLAQRWTSWGGECRFATSHKEVCALLGVGLSVRDALLRSLNLGWQSRRPHQLLPPQRSTRPRQLAKAG
jgi:hypothetical protein